MLTPYFPERRESGSGPLPERRRRKIHISAVLVGVHASWHCRISLWISAQGRRRNRSVLLNCIFIAAQRLWTVWTGTVKYVKTYKRRSCLNLTLIISFEVLEIAEHRVTHVAMSIEAPDITAHGQCTNKTNTKLWWARWEFFLYTCARNYRPSFREAQNARFQWLNTSVLGLFSRKRGSINSGTGPFVGMGVGGWND